MMAESILPDALPAKDKRATSRERRRFSRAVLVSALGHAAVIALIVALWHPEPEEIPIPPIPVTMVEKIGQSGASGGGRGVSAPAARTGESASAANGAAQPEPAAAQPAAPAPPPPSQAPSAPPQTQTPNALPLPAPPVASASIEPVPPHKPAPPQPHEQPKAAPVVMQAAPAQPQPAAPPVEAARSANPAAVASAAPSNEAAAGTGGQGRGDKGAGRAAAGNGSRDGPGDDYLELVRRWVTRFRDYPDEAIKKREEGTVAIGFKFARDGTVLDAWVEKSSGFPMLDNAALKMIHDASPIPKVPDRYQGETLTLVMPENYRIGIFDRIFH